MKHLLGKDGSSALRSLLGARSLLAFDYDGTLAPIRRHTVEAWLTPRTRELWTALGRLRPCAVISGRSLADLRLRMNGTGPCFLVGNHGIEPADTRVPRERWRAQTRAWVAELKTALAP